MRRPKEVLAINCPRGMRFNGSPGEEIRTLEDLVLAEKDQDLRAYANNSRLSRGLCARRRCCGEKPTEKSSGEALDWLFEPFSHVRRTRGRETAKLAGFEVCATTNTFATCRRRGVARLLPSDRYPQTKSGTCRTSTPMGDAGLDQAQGVCFIGRAPDVQELQDHPSNSRGSSVFNSCRRPKTRRGQTGAHVLPEMARGRIIFYCVTQNRPTKSWSASI